ncbi:MAG: fibronectin type III domain-containing protein [Acetobacter sp.]|nr:fibronectin type III domain-containing protein [Bacteroides sp.]MCM1341958.1 fibronectin type III domain-containing protein [Acetobacter sp.]MCM1434143.1 fibronectin type III domain-containing protein [Clostridiales bacterium]
MKKLTKILAVMLAVIMLLEIPIPVFAGTTKSKYTGSTYTHQSQFDGRKITHGIDVSDHNGDINFKKVKADGIDFVFVRVGYTGYTRKKFSLNYDGHYKDNIKNALANGLKVGVYWYSQALTEKEAVDEADKLVSAIKDMDITLPVVMDYEFADVSTGRLDYAWQNKKITKKDMTENALAFLDKITEYGYDPCIYANRSFFVNHVDGAQLAEYYKIWLAEYNTSTPCKHPFDYWQYSSSGKVSGISGKVDMNFFYVPDDTKVDGNVLPQEYTYTNEPITPPVSVISDKTALTQDVDYTLSYSNNINAGYGKIDAVGIGEYEGKSWQFMFKIVPPSPTGITLTDRTTESISLSWDKTPQAKSYQLNITNNTKKTHFTKTVKTNSAKISGLTPANEYTIAIIAGAGSGSKAVWSSESKSCTYHALADKVTGLKATQTANTIKLSWNKKKGCDGYKIYRYISTENKYVAVADVYGENSTSYTVKKLKSGTLYAYRVAAFTKDSVKKIGTKSSLLRTSTKPDKLKIKSVASKSKKKITVKWNKTVCNGYQVQISTSKDFSKNRKTYSLKSSAKTIQKTITTAKSKKTYYVRIRATKTVDNKTVYGAWSSAKKIKVK